MTLREMAEATPATRDRYVDFLRAFSIIVVVLGHWLIAIIGLKNGQVTGRNALDVIPGLWLATWVLQVMPIFFFVGGFSNAVTIDAGTRRGEGYGEFIRGRFERLMRPTLVFLAVWIPICIAADVLSPLGDKTMELGTELLTRPLWFIGIYMIMIALAPPMLRLHRRYGLRALIFMVAGAGLVDVLAIIVELPVIGYLNFAFVWLFVHQLGFFYADGSLPDLGKKVHAAMALGGIAVLVAVTAPGWYSASMVGLVGERSNTNPPTIAIVALTVWQVGLVMLLRRRVSSWLSRNEPWMVVIFLNSVIMTLFLWHQTAMLAAVASLYPLGFPQPKAGTANWWAVRPLWIGSLAVFLAVLVLLFGRFERGAPKPRAGITTGSAALGAALLLIGILGFAVAGFDRFAGEGEPLVTLNVNPLQSLILVLLGIWVFRKTPSKATLMIGLILLGLLEGLLPEVSIDGRTYDPLAGSVADVILLAAGALALLYRPADIPSRAAARS